MWCSEDGWKAEVVGEGGGAAASCKRRKVEQHGSTAASTSTPAPTLKKKEKQKKAAPPPYIVQPAASRAAHDSGQLGEGEKGFLRWLDSYGKWLPHTISPISLFVSLHQSLRDMYPTL